MAGTRDLRILNAVAEALNSALDVREALERTLALVADLLGLEPAGSGCSTRRRTSSTTPPRNICRRTCRSRCA